MKLCSIPNSFILAMCLLFCSYAVSQSDADELAEKLRKLNTLTGQFEQTLVDAQGQILQESSGTFLLQRPGFFRWETLEPFPQLLVSNLQNIWLYDPDLEQVTVRAYNNQLSQTPALLLSGNVEEINQHYTVKKNQQNIYELVPKASQDLFSMLIVVFNNEQLASMVLKDSLEQQTTFRFLQTQYNRAIDPTEFEFVPPAGTDVITAE